MTFPGFLKSLSLMILLYFCYSALMASFILKGPLSDSSNVLVKTSVGSPGAGLITGVGGVGIGGVGSVGVGG
jgi:hypothetical protein